MNKIFTSTLFLLPFCILSAQSLKIEYEVQFKSMNSGDIKGSEEFKKKVAEVQNKPQKHVLIYSDGKSVYESFPHPEIYDMNVSDPFEATKSHSNSYKIDAIKLFKIKEKNGAYSYRNVKNEKYYEYAVPIFNNIKMLDANDTILNYSCKIMEVELINKKKAKVWYTEELPMKTGPLSYYNFPGVVLKIETDYMTVIPKSIDKAASNIELEKMDENLKVIDKTL